eukprot:SAG11_NODE_46482_length_136_cov_25.891892_1_plen_28_part_10
MVHFDETMCPIRGNLRGNDVPSVVARGL